MQYRDRFTPVPLSGSRRRPSAGEDRTSAMNRCAPRWATIMKTSIGGAIGRYPCTSNASGLFIEI
jgi:hypothetical protein